MPGVVSVACKLPHGLKLQLQTSYEISEPVMGGGHRTATYHRHSGPIVTIKGWAVKPGEDEERPLLIGGYAITSNVDADFFAKWREQNVDSDIVKKGFIMAHEKQDYIKSKVGERKGEASGFERCNPASLPQEFKGKIATAELQ